MEPCKGEVVRRAHQRHHLEARGGTADLPTFHMITDKHVIEAINRKLLEYHRVLDGRPIYRVVWSADELEVRKGKFSDWYGDHIFIREYTAVREVKKYWYLTEPAFVLEKLVFIHDKQALKEVCEELVMARNGTYEPIYTFRNSKGLLPVDWEIVDFIVWRLQNPGAQVDHAEMERISEEQEVKYFEEEIGKGEKRTPLFIFDNSVGVSTNQAKFHQEYIESSKEPLVHVDI